jgi:hypothetical protein
MPVNEIETHPFLEMQILGEGSLPLCRYEFLIVGTFPIYPLTLSQPIYQQGHLLRENWVDYCRFQYFYGSVENSFWELFSNSFDEQPPLTTVDAIALLNTKRFLITDAVCQTKRIGYLASDSGIAANKVLNSAGLSYCLNNASNINTIFFTSFVAKKWFCQALRINYLNVIADFFHYNGKKISLFILMSPAGGGRSVNTYIPIFPLNSQEAFNRAHKMPYAKEYRRRYYRDFLNLAINL